MTATSWNRRMMVFLMLFGLVFPATQLSQDSRTDAYSDSVQGTTAQAVGKVVAAGNGFYCAINDAGAVQCWGNNEFGALGNGTTSPSSVDAANRLTVSLGSGLTTTHISGGNMHTCAVTQPGGGVKCWGSFQVMTGGSPSNYGPPRTPTVVQKSGGGALTNIVDISSNNEVDCAVDSSGAVWCWGFLIGGLGVDGDTTDYRPNAVQVSLGGTARSVSAGANSACAVMTDGTVKCWGQGSNGQITAGSSGFNVNPTTVIDQFTNQPLSGVLAMTSGEGVHCALLAANRVTCWGRFATVNVALDLTPGEKVDSITLAYTTLIVLTDQKRAVFFSDPTSASQNKWRPYGVNDPKVISVGRSSTGINSSCAVFVDFRLECAGEIITGFETYAPAPAPPTIPTAVAGDGKATITVASGGGSTPTSYRVTADPGGAFCDVTNPATSMSCVVTPLTNGSTYSFTAIASNDRGTSASGSAVTLTIGLPSKPAEPELTIGNGQITITPQPGLGGGTPDFYTVTLTATSTPFGTFTCTVQRPDESCTITGLTNHTVNDDIAYTVETTAGNDAGTSPASDGVDVQVGPPGTPAVPAITVDDRSATISVSPVTIGGTPAIYTVTATAKTAPFGVHTCTITPPDQSCTIAGLTNDTEYDFITSATNDAGTSAPTQPLTALVDFLPLAPTAPLVEIGSGGDVTVSVEPTGGGLAHFYTVTATATTAPFDTHVCTYFRATESSCTFPNLEQGRVYEFVATATNGIGTSEVSLDSTGPIAAPTAPVIGDIVYGIGQPSSVADVTVSVSPGLDGGAVTSYQLFAGGTSCTVVVPATSCLLRGLTIGQTYTVTASATNGLGSAITPTGMEIDLREPGTPPAPQLLDVGPGSATVSVRPPTDGGVPSSYTVTATATMSPFGTRTCTVTPPATTCTITGLTDGLTYDFTTAATNVFGTSDPSPATTGTVAAPAVPQAPIVRPGSGQATVQIVPGLGGGLVARYIVYAEPGGHVCTVIPPATGCVLNGLTNGVQYTVTTSAVNGFGESAGGAPSKVTPLPPPPPPPTTTIGGGATGGGNDDSDGNGSESTEDGDGADTSLPATSPGELTVELTGGRATVTVTPVDGVPAPAGYVVIAQPGGASCTIVLPATTCSIAGLIDGVEYTFELRMLRDLDGPASAVIGTVTAGGPKVPGVLPGGQLPATGGGDNDVLPLAVFVMALGALVVMLARPRAFAIRGSSN